MLINGIYDPHLFGLKHTDDPEPDSGSFWSSEIRPASVNGSGQYLAADSGGIPTIEYLEIDYGRVRQVMGLMLSIIKLPFLIGIEYDALSSGEETPRWVSVTPEAGLSFDDIILFDSASIPGFARSEFYFSDSKGEIIHTRRLRISFTRRDTPWPTRDFLGTAYPAIVKSLRTFRTVSDHRHMAGPLFMSEVDSATELLQLNVKSDLTTHELTQRFVFPEDATRGEGTATTGDDIVPGLLGFSFLAEVTGAEGSGDDSMASDVEWRWSLWDVTNETQLDTGTTTDAPHAGQCWINCYFNRPLQGDINTTYEIRLSSRHTPASSSVYTSKPIDVPGFFVPSTISAERRSRLFTVDDVDAGLGLAVVGDYIQAVDGLNSYRIRSLGQPGGYASFNGVSGRIDVPYDAAIATATWAASFWYRREASSMDGVVSVIVDNMDYAENGWYVGIGPDGGSLDSALQVTCDNGGSTVTLTDTIDTADGDWHHAFVTHDGTDLKLYRDGAFVDTVAAAGFVPNATALGEGVCFGTKWGTDWDNLLYGSGPWTAAGVRYEGDLDDVVFYSISTDLSATDVDYIYNLGHGGSGTVVDLAAYETDVAGAWALTGIWQLNDAVDSTTVVDAESTNDGTVVPSGVTLTGEAADEYVIEVDRGWREPNGSRRFFIVPRMTYVSGGEYVADYSRSLALRVWSDTGDSGRDILGNQYRYATRLLDSASRVLDPDSPGWMSAPRPSPEAVESLYFDVRQAQATGQQEFAIIDNIRVAPRTHGVRMQVYYTRDNLHGTAPKLTDHWDHMLWTPVNEVYHLRRDEAIQLPHCVQASFIKLEFTNLQPMPFTVSPFPELPPVEYKRYPTWVESAFQNAQVRRTVEDWFTQSQTPIQRRILKEIADPIQEFSYKHREFMTALSHGLLEDPRVLGSGIVDAGTSTFLDPVTGSKIRFTPNTLYRGSLVATLRDESLLNRSLRARNTPVVPLLREATPRVEAHSPFVSTRGDRITHSFSDLAETPMWFNRKCRHYYRTDRARFNRKAYYVGIRDVEFRRNDYTVEHDDPIIDDNLYDDLFLDLNSFVRDGTTIIADGQVVYVSYTVDNVIYTDEPASLIGNRFINLLNVGFASDIKVYSHPNSQGIGYAVDTDYMVANGYNEGGEVVTQIARSDMTEFLEVDPSATYGITFQDSGVASGLGLANGEDET